jgi:hypothetical protein
MRRRRGLDSAIRNSCLRVVGCNTHDPLRQEITSRQTRLSRVSGFVQSPMSQPAEPLVSLKGAALYNIELDVKTPGS